MSLPPLPPYILVANGGGGGGGGGGCSGCGTATGTTAVAAATATTSAVLPECHCFHPLLLKISMLAAAVVVILDFFFYPQLTSPFQPHYLTLLFITI